MDSNFQFLVARGCVPFGDGSLPTGLPKATEKGPKPPKPWPISRGTESSNPSPSSPPAERVCKLSVPRALRLRWRNQIHCTRVREVRAPNRTLCGDCQKLLLEARSWARHASTGRSPKGLMVVAMAVLLIPGSERIMLGLAFRIAVPRFVEQQSARSPVASLGVNLSRLVQLCTTRSNFSGLSLAA